ncbi:hypothetical protein [Amycolatopsis sp. NPDC004625]|uniref:hypothetical protein n=1 Tax=Amycolatopsis sp. NPDC004625 TaxID=3154670 RepID=UPI0033A095CD
MSDTIEFTPPLHQFLDRRATTFAVVAPWGADESVLVEQFQFMSLWTRERGDPVAVRVPLETWRAGRSLESWIIRFLANKFSLAHTTAWSLVNAALVYPIVEDVDELATGLREQFLAAVRATAFPMLLTSRFAEFVRDFPSVHLSPLTAADRLRRWPKVAGAVRDDPAAPLAAVLDDPVGRELFFAVHEEDKHDPALLLDRNFFPDQRAIERHLAAELGSSRLLLLRGVAQFSAAAEDGCVAWWRLADSVSRQTFLDFTTVVAVATGCATALAVWAAVPKLPLSAAAVVAAVVAIVLAMALSSLARPRFPQAVEWSRWRRASTAWLAGAPGMGLAAGVVSVVAGLHWTSLIGAVLTGLCVGVIGVQRTLLVERGDETLLDAPALVLAQDRAPAFLRIFLAMAAAFFATVTWTGTSKFDVLEGILLLTTPLAAAVPMTAGSTYFRYKIAVGILKPGRLTGHDAVGTLSAVPRLVRRDGGLFVFHDAAVREHLAELRLEPAYPSVWDPAEFVLAKRHGMAETACRDADVAGAINLEEYRGFVDRIAEDIKGNRTALLASTAAARQSYATAKRRYAESVLKIPIDAAVGIEEVSRQLPLVGATAASIVPAAFVLDRVGLSWTSTAGVVLAAAVLTALVSWPLRRSSDPMLRLAAAGVVLGSLIALAFKLSLRFQAMPPVMGTVLIWLAAAVGVGSWLAWGLTGWLRSLIAKVRSDSPADWPSNGFTTWTETARADAEAALDAWLAAMVERGVAPLVAERLNRIRQRSYDRELPDADVRKLGDVTDVAQYVPTDTSGRLVRTLKSMTRGAIGISGPRGVGKSTVLKMFGELNFGTDRDDLALVVPAPTNYGSRDFLVHLYTTVCTSVLAAAPEPRRRRRRWPWLLASAIGAIGTAVAWQWPALVGAVHWVPPNWRTVVMAAGPAGTVVALVGWHRAGTARREPNDDLVVEARHRLSGLRFVVTTTVTRSAALKPPAMAEFGGSLAMAQAAQLKTLPELVGEFRNFLSLLARGHRVLICIDELDKIASAPEAERILNDLKALFGIENCFFLVAVSDDALAGFSRRSLTVRTAFDSAFDTVVTVGRFELAETRRLLVQRVSALPEPFVWLCHTMSGGLPRDLNRAVRELYDLSAAHREKDLATLSREMIHADLDAVADALSVRLADRFDGPAIRLRQHILNARRLPAENAALLAYRPLRWTADAPDDLTVVYAQFRCYLAYAAAILRAFGDNADAVVAALRETDADAVRYLVQARAWLPLDPVAAAAYVDDWQTFERAALNRAP